MARWGTVMVGALTRPTSIGAVWFVATMGTMLWMAGVAPLAFASPDEALDRFAAKLIATQGNPILALPFRDIEDLAHPRFWVSLGDHAVPAYAPVALYLYGMLVKIPGIGAVLVTALAASGAAAFAAGTARLLPPGRRALALLSPMLGFPALHFLLRPWLNASVLLVCLCWALFAWATWRQSGSSRWLAAALFCVGAGAAVRPDYAAYLLLVALLFTVAASPEQYRRIALLVGIAGAGAVIANLVLNRVITGHPFQAAYQLLIDRSGDDAAEGGPPLRKLPGMLGPLLLPMGLPPLEIIAKVFVKYWVEMGPVGLLLFGQAAVVPLLLAQKGRQRALYAAGLVAVLCFIVSRTSDAVFGSKVAVGMVHHSMPRYWAPAFLFAALPPLLFLGRTSSRIVLALGLALACTLGWLGAQELRKGRGGSFTFLHDLQHRNERTLARLRTKVPGGAVVYTITQDKILWSDFRVCMIGAPEPTAASMERAMDARLRVFAMDPAFDGGRSGPLGRQLRARHLTFARIDAGLGLYRLERTPTQAVPAP